MKTHRFENGDEIPLLGLGTWKSEPGEVGAAVREALRVGYRHIDCAPIYENEPEIGDAVARSIAEGRVERHQLWITSKLWNDAHAPDDVLPALERTLTDLRLDYLDLYLIHWPVVLRPGAGLPESGSDFIPLEEVPIAATWEGMEAAVDRGLVRHVGVSNFSALKLGALLDEARIRPEVDQVELHPYLQQPKLVEFCRREGVLVTAYSPLGSSDRPERLKADDEPNLLEDPRIGEIANRQGITPAQVLIAWALERGTAVIPKSTNPGRLAENFGAAGVELDEDEMEQIAALDRRRRFIDGAFWDQEGNSYSVEDLWDETPEGEPLLP